MKLILIQKKIIRFFNLKISEKPMNNIKNNFQFEHKYIEDAQ